MSLCSNWQNSMSAHVGSHNYMIQVFYQTVVGIQFFCVTVSALLAQYYVC